MRLRLNIILTLGSIALSPVASAQYLGDVIVQNWSLEAISEVGTVQAQILENTQGAPPHDPLRLAKAFVASAHKYNLPPNLLAAVAMVESRYYVGAVNKKSNDFGIMQVNQYNIDAMGLSKKRLLTDIEYSIDSGARILAYFAKRYYVQEGRDWVCRYNIGTRKKTSALEAICKRYNKKVRRAM